MSEMQIAIVVMLGYGVVSAVAGTYIARQKGRDEGEGAIFGFLFGPIGLLIVALLPNAYQEKKVEPIPQNGTPTVLTHEARTRALRRA